MTTELPCYKASAAVPQPAATDSGVQQSHSVAYSVLAPPVAAPALCVMSIASNQYSLVCLTFVQGSPAVWPSTTSMPRAIPSVSALLSACHAVPEAASGYYGITRCYRSAAKTRGVNPGISHACEVVNSV